MRQKGYSFEFNPDFAAAWKDSSWRVIEQQLQEMREIGRANSFAVFLVAVPYAEQFRPDYLSRNRDHVLKPQRALGSICARLGIAFLDLYPRLDRKAHFDSDRVHLTEAGRQHAAEAIAAFLKEKRLIPAEGSRTAPRLQSRHRSPKSAHRREWFSQMHSAGAPGGPSAARSCRMIGIRNRE